MRIRPETDRRGRGDEEGGSVTRFPFLPPLLTLLLDLPGPGFCFPDGCGRNPQPKAILLLLVTNIFSRSLMGLPGSRPAWSVIHHSTTSRPGLV